MKKNLHYRGFVFGKRSLVLLLVAIAVVAGCSSGGTNPPNPDRTSGAEPNASPGQASGETASDAEQAEAVPSKYDPPIVLTTVKEGFGTLEYGEGEEMNNNRWYRYIKEQLGIEMNALWEVPSDQLEQKTNLMIATGEIPDIFLATPSQYVQLIRAGLVEDLTEVYERHATDNVKEIFELSGPEVLDSAIYDGRLMGIPWSGIQKESSPVLWIREDWLANLDLSAPASMGDLYAIAAAFTHEDPDGNGQADTYGLPLDKDLNLLNGFFNAHHAYKGIWIQDGSGGLVYGSVQPEVRTVLAKLRDVFRDGQIDKEFGVKAEVKVQESIGQNKLGIYMTNMTGSYVLAAMTPDIRWTPLSIPSIDEHPVRIQHPVDINYGYWVVKKGTEHPEAIMKLLDLWVEIFYKNTKDDIRTTMVTDGVVAYQLQFPVKIYKPYKNIETAHAISPLLKSEQPATAEQLEALTPEQRTFYRDIMKFYEGDESMWRFAVRNGPGGSGDVITGYRDNGQFLSDQFTTVPTPTMVQKQAILKKMEHEMMTKIIAGGPIELFDQFVEEWHQLGGEQMTREVNDWYSNK